MSKIKTDKINEAFKKGLISEAEALKMAEELFKAFSPIVKGNGLSNRNNSKKAASMFAVGIGKVALVLAENIKDTEAKAILIFTAGNMAEVDKQLQKI